MTVICPTVLAQEPHEFREQLERITPFAKRIQIDLMDGVFAPTSSVHPEQLWWHDTQTADIHLMYQRPAEYLDQIIKLKPNMLIVHAEAEGNFVEIARKLQEAGIKAGIALLPETPVATVSPAIDYIDHLLIFSGSLGRFGGKADLSLIGKAAEIKNMKTGIEIGWDGGINDSNARQLAEGGIDVLNIGGYIQNASDPEAAYATLKALVDGEE